MTDYIEALQILAEKFARLQGVGRKSAMRMAFSVLDLEEEDAQGFAEAILNAKRNIHKCPVCGNLTDKDVCYVCSDLSRDTSVICVVEDVKALMSIEKVRAEIIRQLQQRRHRKIRLFSICDNRDQYYNDTQNIHKGIG